MKHGLYYSLLLFGLLLQGELTAQSSTRPYLNAGYVTNVQKCDECEKADTGGSIRAGILTRGRMGYYVGYLWFKEFHPSYVPYDDKGRVIMAGVDILLFKTGSADWYGKVGITREEFISTYPDREESETSIKPDFGLFVNISHFNVYGGWQPSDPSHINIGIGFTL